MNYEQWRITFQSSEQAARSAFEDAQRWERLTAMTIGSIVELHEAAGIRKEDQLAGGTIQALTAIEKLKERREKWKARALKAEQWNREMVVKAANNHLEGYRELGRRAAAGDPHGKLMQPELITHIAALNAHHIPDARKMVSGPCSTACDDQFRPQPVGIKPATMPSQIASATCTLLGGDHAPD